MYLGSKFSSPTTVLQLTWQCQKWTENFMFHFLDISTTLLRFYSSFLDGVIVEFFLTSEKRRCCLFGGPSWGTKWIFHLFIATKLEELCFFKRGSLNNNSYFEARKLENEYNKKTAFSSWHHEKKVLSFYDSSKKYNVD